MYFAPRGEGEKRRGLMLLGFFLFCFVLFFFGDYLPQTSAWPRKYLPVIFVRLRAKIFIKIGVENHW